jgi:hypothetical protein
MRANSETYFAAATLRYLEEARDVQELLHQILTQMSGFALMLFTRSAGPSLCAGPLDIAGQRMKRARAQLVALRPSGDAGHHFHHLGEATNAIERCLDVGQDCLRAGSEATDRDELARGLRLAVDHLRMTSRLLPGFSMVDLRQACCAAHTGTAHAGAAGAQFVAANA